ncbi:MAG: hypothetical protein ACK401_01050 [Archaeoglobaceae archaeon]
MYLVKTLALAVAIAISIFHWIGIAITSAMIGFLAKSYKSALLFSSLYAVAFWISFLAYSVTLGIAEKLLALPFTYLSLTLTVALATISSMLRALK